MATTTNYGWTTPNDTDLVKDGADAIRTLGSSVDTSLWNVGYGQAGKNKILNADFRINQRNFSSVTVNGIYGFDRWIVSISGDGTTTYTPQTFTPGDAPVSGYEAINFARIVTTGQTSATVRSQLAQRIEDVRTFAGQTVTLSFWAKAATGTPKVGGTFLQNFGTGGSPSGSVFGTGQVVTISTSWARYSFTFSMPSISGKTFGTNLDSYVGFFLGTSAGTDPSVAWAGPIGIQSATIDFWGVQLEAGSTATPFQTATGTLQGELAACQRYYIRQGGDTAFQTMAWGQAFSATSVTGVMTLPVKMRVAPTSVEFSTIRATNQSAGYAITAVGLDSNFNSSWQPVVNCTTSGLTAALFYFIGGNNSTSSYLAFSAEL
jgi:hypothetical protein